MTLEVPEVCYARSGDVAIAYQVVGSGSPDIVFIRGTLADLLTAWEQPLWVRHVEGLAECGRVIMFDKRGTGLSDRPPGLPPLEARMDDVRAVLDHLGSDEAVLWTAQEGTRIAVLFAATYPERTTALVAYSPSVRGVRAPDYPWAPSEDDWRRELRDVRQRWGERDYFRERLRGHSPTVADDPEFQDWFTLYMRRSASPGAAAMFVRMQIEGDVRDVLSSVRAPTLIGHGPAQREEARYVAGQIPGAHAVEIEGLRDVFSWANPPANDRLLDETKRFLADRGPSPAVDRILTTVLFTDIVGSTERAAALGDERWRSTLEAHDRLALQAIERRRGRAVKRTGDGVLATFDGPARALQTATAIRDAARSLGLEIRAGVHTGECELRGDDVAGIAVHIGARVAALAGPGEVMTSSTVRDLVAGSGIAFEDRGTHELKGVPGEWRLYAVA